MAEAGAPYFMEPTDGILAEDSERRSSDTEVNRLLQTQFVSTSGRIRLG